MLDFRVNTFLTVCELGNYTKTAEKLGLTQPAVTQHIRFIEDRYKVKLLLKDGKSMKLTEAGEALRDMFITLQADEKKIGRRLSELNRKPGPLVMGTTKSMGEYVMPRIIKKYTEAYPLSGLLMEVENSAKLVEKLKKGELEFLISEDSFDENIFWSRSFSKERLRCLCSPDSELADKTVSAEMLFENRIIIREEGSGTRKNLDNLLKQMGYSLRNFSSALVVGSPSAIKKLVADNCGITFMYESAAEKELHNNTLSSVNVEGFDKTYEFNFICLKDSMFINDFGYFFDFASENRQVF